MVSMEITSWANKYKEHHCKRSWKEIDFFVCKMAVVKFRISLVFVGLWDNNAAYVELRQSKRIVYINN
jgi:hypothetical protein